MADIVAAEAVISTGRVLVDGAVADKANRQVASDQAIVVRPLRGRFVSRGGEKLDAALDAFRIDPTGARVLDAGASTGGFSDCLLQRGAMWIAAIDVGYGQLHGRVAGDPRVVVLDRTHIRDVDLAVLGGPTDLVVADLSFISLTRVVDPLIGACREGGDIVILVKPQFEAERSEVTAGRGVVTDPAIWRRALVRVIAAFERAGAAIMGVMASPITGAEGNVEFLVHVHLPLPVAAGTACVPLQTATSGVAVMIDTAIGSVATE